MLSHGSRAARTACVRCDLRSVIHAIPRTTLSSTQAQQARTPRCRHLTSAARQLQEYAEVEDLEDGPKRRPYRYKHIHPHGRIIGRPGKRQRQSVETLSINSLGERSSVIVLRDVPDDDVATSHEKPISTAGVDELQEYPDAGAPTGAEPASFTIEETLPERQAVQKSIDGMQPQHRLLEDHEYQELKKRLMDAHNQRQLAHFMRSALASMSERDDYDLVTVEQRSRGKSKQKSVEALPKSRWRPGTTPLAKRHTLRGAVHASRTSGSPKERIAEQIIRNVWNVSLSSEQQELGELELKLVPWQAALLFTTTLNGGQSQAERVIDSELLVRSSKLALSQVDSVLRIIARRQDAEEIARRIEHGLLRAGTYVFDLEPYKHLLGPPGRPSASLQLWADEELQDVSQLTATVMHYASNSKLEVHGFNHNAVMRATRMLKSLLNLEPHKTEKHLVLWKLPSRETQELVGVKPYFYPVHLTEEQRRRFRGQSTSRLARPTSAEGELDQDHGLGGSLNFAVASRQILEDAEKFLKLRAVDWQHLYSRLRDSILKAPPETVQSACWTAADTVYPSKRHIEVGQLLYTDKGDALQPPRRGRRTVSRPRISHPGTPKAFLNHVSAAPPLLSYFKPKPGADADMTSHGEAQEYIDVVYVPAFLKRNGATALEDIPRLTFRFSRTVGSADEYALKRVRAVLRQRVFSVSLPFAAVDLRFVEEAHLVPNMVRLVAEPQVRMLCDALNQSLNSIDHFSNMYLPNSIMVPLPRWLLHGAQQKKSGNSSSRITALGNMDLASAAAWQDEPYAYFLEHVQLSRSTYYVPITEGSLKADMDPTMLALQEQMLKSGENGVQSQAIRIREINSGPLGGRRTELTIHPPLYEWEEHTAKYEDVVAVKHDLINTGLAVVDAITKVERGQLSALNTKRSSSPSSQSVSESQDSPDEDFSHALNEISEEDDAEHRDT